jgi:hypothetical protein
LDRGFLGRRHTTYFWIGWCLILWVGAFLRLSHPDWDQGIAAHPDERFILGVAQDMPIYGNPCTVSPDFPYGHFPLSLLSLLVNSAPQADPLYAGRLISGLGGILLVALAGRCGSELSRAPSGGLIAAGLAAFCPLLIQHSHFYTVDPWAAIFGTLAVLSAARFRRFWSGLFVGLALACKASSAWIGVSVGIAIAISAPGQEWIHRGFIFVAGSMLGILLGSPWLLLTPLQCWRGPLVQAQLAAGRFIFPYTRQYVQTTPWVYPFIQMVVWAMGPLPTIIGAVTLVKSIAAWREGRKFKILTFAPVLFYIAVASLYVKYPRYLLPIYPLWIGAAAKGLLDLCHTLSKRIGRRLCSVGLLVVISLTGIMGIAQASVYRSEHPWLQASRWIYRNVRDSSSIAVESWDHPLPVPLSSGDPSNYDQMTVPVLDHSPSRQDDAAARERARMASVVVLASRRNYGVVTRQPDRYRGVYSWYEAMFRARKRLVFSRCPKVGPVAFSDNPFRALRTHKAPDLRDICDARFIIELPRLDESLRVYDAPITVLLVRTE